MKLTKIKTWACNCTWWGRVTPVVFSMVVLLLQHPVTLYHSTVTITVSTRCGTKDKQAKPKNLTQKVNENCCSFEVKVFFCWRFFQGDGWFLKSWSLFKKNWLHSLSCREINSKIKTWACNCTWWDRVAPVVFSTRCSAHRRFTKRQKQAFGPFVNCTWLNFPHTR